MAELSIQTGQYRKVEIDGEKYELLNTGDLDFPERVALKKHGDKLRKIDELSEEEVKEASAEFKQWIKRILKAPDEVHDKLNLDHRQEILAFFFGIEKTEKENSTPSSNSSPQSSDSTAGAGGNGSPALTPS